MTAMLRSQPTSSEVYPALVGQGGIRHIVKGETPELAVALCGAILTPRSTVEVWHQLPEDWRCSICVRMIERPWSVRGERLLERALSEVRDDEDAIATVSAAVQALRIDAGEADPATMDDYPFPGEDRPELECICPPDLVARGGFKSGCPVHG